MTEKAPSTLYALKIALPYLLAGWAWVLFSDRFLQHTISDLETLTILQTYKGWFFITISALLVYLTARHYLDRLSKTYQVINAQDIALTENQQGMFTLLANLPGMAYRCHHDDNRQMEFVSEGCQALTGFESADFVRRNGAPWNNVILDEDRDIVRHEINRAVRDRTSYKIEYRIRTKSGRMTWVAEQGCAIHSAIEAKKILVGYIFEIDEAGMRDRRHQESDRNLTNSTAGRSSEQSVNQGPNLLSRSF
jgi:PAS domain S-box-containing protein